MGMLSLMEHQEDGIRWLRDPDRPRALLADEPGLGKSAQLLKSAVEPVLILAPAMVIESGTWDDEIAKWEPGIEATQVPYSNMIVRGKNGRVTRGAHNVPIVALKPELRRPWGTVIADESHYLKGRKTSWTHAARQLDARQFFQATGTPIPNWAHEAFMTLQLMYPDLAKPGGTFGSYWRWAEDWFVVTGSRWDPNAKEIGDLRPDRTWEQFYELNWAGNMIRRFREDVLKDLPPLTHQVWKVKMMKEQRRVYTQLKKDFIAWLDSGEQVEAWSTPALFVKLAKAATGLDVLDPNVRCSGSFNALREIVENRPMPTMVVGHFQDTVEQCARIARELGKTVGVVHGGVSSAARKDSIRGFQAGALDVMCATIDTISEGMTLHQGGADMVIRVERSASPHKNDQVARRLHRIGVERPITMIDLVTENSYQEKMIALAEAKSAHQERALTAKDYRELVR